MTTDYLHIKKSSLKGNNRGLPCLLCLVVGLQSSCVTQNVQPDVLLVRSNKVFLSKFAIFSRILVYSFIFVLLLCYSVIYLVSSVVLPTTPFFIAMVSKVSSPYLLGIFAYVTMGEFFFF